MEVFVALTRGSRNSGSCLGMMLFGAGRELSVCCLSEL